MTTSGTEPAGAGVPPFARRFLLPRENDVICLRQHPAVLRSAALLLLAALAAAGWLTAAAQSTVLTDTGWIACLYPAGRLAIRAAAWRRTCYLVTAYRVMLVTGIATRQVAMAPAQKITGIGIERDPPGRLLGYGTIIIESPVQHPALQRMTYVPQPERAYAEISAVIFSHSTDPDP